MNKCINCNSQSFKIGKIEVCQQCGVSCSDEIASIEIAKIVDMCGEVKENETNKCVL